MSGTRTQAADTTAATPFIDGIDPDDRPFPPRRRRVTWRTGRHALTLLLALAISLAWAFMAVMVLDASAWPAPKAALLHEVVHLPALAQSVAVTWVLVLLVLALVGRLWLSMGLITAFVALIGVVNMTKLDLRNDPVYPSDYVFLGQPSFLFEMVSPLKLVLGLLGLVVIVALAALFGRLMGKPFPGVAKNVTGRARAALRVVRLLVVVLCLLLLWSASNFNEAGNPWRKAFDATGLRWRAWDQRVNYQRNGFVAGLLYNMHVTAMKEPKGYSKAAVMRIADKYAAEAADLNRGRTGSLDKTNVVTVLSESYSDPNWLKSVKYPTNPMPRTEALMKRTLSGRMLAPGYGSGTANVEFEVLSGMSMSQLSPQVTVAYEQMVSHYKTFPTAVSWFLDHGHTPIAIHPFSPRMYDRPEVYKSFGFDKFITKDELQQTSRGGGRFIDDKSAFDEVLHQIDTHSKPVLAHLVTMQNHMPFGGQYTDPIKPSGLTGSYARLAGQYGRGVARTDQELADFLAKVKQSPEPTAVVFWGDHLPPQIYPQSLFKKEGLRRMHETPFLIWSNKAALKHTDLPTTSPTQFLPKLFDALDVPIPPWYALLDSLDKQIPAMDAGLYIDSSNQTQHKRTLTAEQKKVLSDYQMIMYDLSIGKRYSEKTMYSDAK